MKNLKYIFLFTLVISSCAIKHSLVKHSNGYIPFGNFKGDTLAYLKSNFVKQKDKYLHKPFSAILNDMELPVQSYQFGPGKDTLIYSLSVSPYNYQQLTKKIDTDTNPLFIYVILERGPSERKAFDVKKQNNGRWDKSTSDFYGKQIVKDVGVTDY